MNSQLQVISHLVKQAGHQIHQMARDGFSTAYKENKDPVTTADLAADTILRENLLELMPGSGWLSEETRDNPDRLEKEYVWVVDPIDGTKEYVSGIPEFSVSVALIQNGRPVLAVIFNPATSELFSAVRGGGTTLNGKPVRTDRPLEGLPEILASRSEIKRGEFEQFKDISHVTPMGSIAYKLARVAAGTADATFSLGPKNEWDIAAGHAVLAAAGGRVNTVKNGPLSYAKPDFLNPAFVARGR
jgi:myo-inositol-1(or 4)-monophosphatase